MSEKWSKLGAELWLEEKSIGGTPAEAYFRGRGISLLPGPEVLRFHLAAEHPKLRHKLPALIAQVTGGVEPSHNFTWLAAALPNRSTANRSSSARDSKRPPRRRRRPACRAGRV